MQSSLQARSLEPSPKSPNQNTNTIIDAFEVPYWETPWLSVVCSHLLQRVITQLVQLQVCSWLVLIWRYLFTKMGRDRTKQILKFVPQVILILSSQLRSIVLAIKTLGKNKYGFNKSKKFMNHQFAFYKISSLTNNDKTHSRLNRYLALTTLQNVSFPDLL